MAGGQCRNLHYREDLFTAEVILEAFEQFVALALESEGLVVSSALKFPVTRQTRKTAHTEVQTHGFEVDLVAADRERLVLATVKSYFGSRGVVAADVAGHGPRASGYALLNDPVVRQSVLAGAADRFGYSPDRIRLRLYVGKFAGAGAEEATRSWCAGQSAGGGPVEVVNAAEVVQRVRGVAASKSYRDNAVLATLKVLEATGALR